jgi:hypothetical protein
MPQLRNLLGYLPVDGCLHHRGYYDFRVHLRSSLNGCYWGTLVFKIDKNGICELKEVIL